MRNKPGLEPVRNSEISSINNKNDYDDDIDEWPRSCFYKMDHLFFILEYSKKNKLIFFVT